MSVAEDGNEQELSGETSRSADRAARHRVPPTASASAKVPILPEPFNPAKPTFPTGPAIPRQRRGGPTAIATASIPAVPVSDDEPEFDDFFIGEPDPSDLSDPSGLSDGSDASDAVDASDRFDAADPSSGDAAGDVPGAVQGGAADRVSAGASGDAAGGGADPATVGTLAGEVRASTAQPVALVEPPALVDPAGFAPAAPLPAPVAAASFAPAGPLAASGAPVGEVAGPDVLAMGVAPVLVTADDSPTVADYVPPAFAIVTDDPAEQDGPDYRGSRRRAAAWRRYPVGAVAVAVLILLVTAAVVLQLVRSNDDGRTPAADASTQQYPGVGGLPELTKGATTPSPSGAQRSATPSPTRSKSSAPAVGPASASASPSKSTASVAPPPLLNGQLRGAGAGKCLEYRSGESNRAVIDNCDARDSGRTNQHWTFQGDGTVRADGGCLDVLNAGTANQTPVRLFTCNATPAQKWTLRGDGTLQNLNSKRCLDVQSAATGAGSPVIIWDCSAAPNQQWTVQPY